MQMQNGDRISVKPIISTDLLDYNVSVREYGMDITGRCRRSERWLPWVIGDQAMLGLEVIYQR